MHGLWLWVEPGAAKSGLAILEVDTASHSGLLYAAEGENILYFTIETITFSLLKFFGSVSELICA